MDHLETAEETCEAFSGYTPEDAVAAQIAIALALIDIAQTLRWFKEQAGLERERTELSNDLRGDCEADRRA